MHATPETAAVDCANLGRKRKRIAAATAMRSAAHAPEVVAAGEKKIGRKRRLIAAATAMGTAAGNIHVENVINKRELGKLIFIYTFADFKNHEININSDARAYITPR